MKRTIVLFLVFTLFGFLSATVFTIGTGTTQDYYTPINSYYNFSWSRSIYTKAEINTSGLNAADNIVSLGLQTFQNVPNFVVENQFIYMRHTTASAETSSYSGTAGFILVYSGPIIFFATGWKIIDLTTPFAWNNTDNVEILWENHDGTWQNMPVNFMHHSTAANLTVHNYSDEAIPTGDGTLTVSRPNLNLYTDNNTPPEPAVMIYPPNAQTMLENQPVLSWNSNGGAPTGYKLYFGTTNPPPFIGDLGMVNTWTPAAALPYNTVHYWQLVPYNAHGDAVGCPIWSFTTRSEWETAVGTGTVQLPIPVLTPYNRSYIQFIYPQEKMNLPHHKIASISFHWSAAYDNTYSNDVVIYLGNTDRDVFAMPSDWVPIDSLTIIFNGYLDLSAGDRWITFPISPSFNYDVTKNLVIAVDENTPGGDTSDPGGFFCTMTSNDEMVGMLGISMAGDVMPTDPVATSDGFNIVNAFPNLRLTLADDIAPTISFLPVLNTPRADAYIHFDATITDNVGVLDPRIWIAHLPSTTYESFPLYYVSGDTYRVDYIGISLGDHISYYFTATDAQNNLATSTTSNFYVQDPTWLRYTANTGNYVGYTSYVWGPGNLYANPFYGSDHKMKINAVEGRPYHTVGCNLKIYSCTTATPSWSNMQLVYGPQALTLTGATTTVIDLAAHNIYIDTPYFIVAFTDMPTGNYWARNASLFYYKSYMFRGTGIYSSGGYGTWVVSAYVQTGPDVVLAAPMVSITDTVNGPTLTWNAVPGTPYYNIFSSSSPYEWGFPFESYEGTVTVTSFTFGQSDYFARRFFRVTATTQVPSKSRQQAEEAVTIPEPDVLPDVLEE